MGNSSKIKMLISCQEKKLIKLRLCLIKLANILINKTIIDKIKLKMQSLIGCFIV
jgi:hypothetical protein